MQCQIAFICKPRSERQWWLQERNENAHANFSFAFCLPFGINCFQVWFHCWSFWVFDLKTVKICWKSWASFWKLFQNFWHKISIDFVNRTWNLLLRRWQCNLEFAFCMSALLSNPSLSLFFVPSQFRTRICNKNWHDPPQGNHFPVFFLCLFFDFNFNYRRISIKM